MLALKWWLYHVTLDILSGYIQDDSVKGISTRFGAGHVRIPKSNSGMMIAFAEKYPDKGI